MKKIKICQACLEDCDLKKENVIIVNQIECGFVNKPEVNE